MNKYIGTFLLLLSIASVQSSESGWLRDEDWMEEANESLGDDLDNFLCDYLEGTWHGGGLFELF